MALFVCARCSRVGKSSRSRVAHNHETARANRAPATMAAETIADRIEQDAIAGVQRVSVDGTSVDAMPIADRIKAAEFTAQQTAKSKNHQGLTFVQLTPGGCG